MQTFQKDLELDQSEVLLEKCLSISNSIQQRVSNMGFSISPDTEESKQAFLSKRPEIQNGIISNFSSYLSVLGSISVESPNVTTVSEERDHLNAAFSKFGFSQANEIKEHIEKGDIIEIYSIDGLQLYRNLNFFKICRYSLLELSTYEWFSLYTRSDSVTKAIWDSVHKCAALKSPGVLPFGGGTYLLKENLFDRPNIYHVQNKVIGPVKDSSDTTVGVVTILRAYRIGLDTETFVPSTATH